MKKISFFVLLSTITALAIPYYAFSYSSTVLNLSAANGQYLYISPSTQKSLAISGDMTAECWVNSSPISPVNPTNLNIMARDDDQNGRGYGFNLGIDITGVYAMSMYNSSDGTNQTVTGLRQVQIPGFAPNTWHHLAWVFRSSQGEFDAYLDGVYQGTANGLNTSTYTGPVEFSVGKLNVGTIYTFDGMLDNCRMWNVARTQRQIANNINRVVRKNARGLVAQWTFENMFVDSSRQNNDLTPVNGASTQAI